MKVEDQGFISITSSIADTKTFFVGNEIPQEGSVLELVVAKKEDDNGSCTLVLKLREAQK